MREMGTSGTAVIGGYVFSKEKSSSLLGAQRYRTASEMMCNASIVAAGLRDFLNLLAKPQWTVEAAKLPGQDEPTDEAKKLAEFVEEVMGDMQTPWHRIIRRSGLYRFHGFGIHEWTAKRRDDGKTGMSDIEVRPNHTIMRWEVDEGGTVLGAWQTHPTNGRELPLPIGKVIYFVDDTLTDSPEGLGWFRHLVDSHERLANYYRLEGYGFQRDLSGTPIGRAPLQAINEAVTAGRITREQGNDMIAGLEEFVKLQAKQPNTGFMMDSAMYTSQTADGKSITAAPMWGLELLTGTQTSLDKIDKAILRTQHDMAYIMGCEHLLLGADGKGSLALSTNKNNRFFLNIESTLADVRTTMDKDYIDPIWRLNGLPDELKPKFKTEAVAFKDVDQIMAGMRDMATAGAVLQPDDPVINEVRDLLGVSHQPEIAPELLGMARDSALGILPEPEPIEDPDADDGELDERGEPARKPPKRAAKSAIGERPLQLILKEFDPQ